MDEDGFVDEEDSDDDIEKSVENKVREKISLTMIDAILLLVVVFCYVNVEDMFINLVFIVIHKKTFNAWVSFEMEKRMREGCVNKSRPNKILRQPQLQIYYILYMNV